MDRLIYVGLGWRSGLGLHFGLFYFIGEKELIKVNYLINFKFKRVFYTWLVLFFIFLKEFAMKIKNF